MLREALMGSLKTATVFSFGGLVGAFLGAAGKDGWDFAKETVKSTFAKPATTASVVAQNNNPVIYDVWDVYDTYKTRDVYNVPSRKPGGPPQVVFGKPRIDTIARQYGYYVGTDGQIHIVADVDGSPVLPQTSKP
jgi:hypothetical protein